MTDREKLVSKIEAQGVRAGDIVVSLEDFFTGNDDRGSIGCNLGKAQPPIRTFFRVLRDIRSRLGVQDVLVRVCEFDHPSSWPYTDTVYVLTSASLEEVQHWVAPLKPDEVYAEWMYEPPPKAPALKPGMVPFSVWWD